MVASSSLSIPNYLPFVSPPALKSIRVPKPDEMSDTNQLANARITLKNPVDKVRIVERITVSIALASIAVAALYHTYPSFSLFTGNRKIATIFATSAFSIFTYIVELRKANKAFNQLDSAVSEYLTEDPPSEQTMNIIRNSVSAAYLLATQVKPQDSKLNKTDRPLCIDANYEVFRVLIEHGAIKYICNDLTKPDQLFNQLAASARNDHLTFLLREYKFQIGKIIKNCDQHHMWLCYVKNEKTAQLLKQLGFDPDTRDLKTQETPLMKVSKENSIYTPTQKDRIKALLAAGANPQLKNANGQTASDLTTNPEIKQLLLESSSHRP